METTINLCTNFIKRKKVVPDLLYCSFIYFEKKKKNINYILCLHLFHKDINTVIYF